MELLLTRPSLSSLDLAAEYEKAKVASEKATETSTVNYTKKRSIFGEVKHYREQKEEIAKWEKMKEDQVRTYLLYELGQIGCSRFIVLQEELVAEYMLWRLFHIQEEIESCEKNIEEAETKIDDLKAVQVSSRCMYCTCLSEILIHG